MSQLNSPRKLPVFRGYTVDARLLQFRRCLPGQMLAFIPFNSPQGQELLADFYDEQPKLFIRVMTEVWE